MSRRSVRKEARASIGAICVLLLAACGSTTERADAPARPGCGGSGPACAGSCPAGYECRVDAANRCFCDGAIGPCGAAHTPDCNGACPAGSGCKLLPGGGCGCVAGARLPCNQTAAPACFGAGCPPGYNCVSSGAICRCL
jgi:hypothetical protein